MWFSVTKKISEVFDALIKYETDSTEKETKFWNQIDECKAPLGEILDESKFKLNKIFKFEFLKISWENEKSCKSKGRRK